MLMVATLNSLATKLITKYCLLHIDLQKKSCSASHLFKPIPKTLIFAKSDAHATNIVKVLKEQIFPDQNENFVQKITYSAGDSNDLIRKFRNDRDFRIAVTVTLVAEQSVTLATLPAPIN